MRSRGPRASIPAVLPDPHPADSAAESSAPESALLPITDMDPKCHRPVLAYRDEGGQPVLSRRTPDLGWIHDSTELPLGWDPVGYRQPD